MYDELIDMRERRKQDGIKPTQGSLRVEMWLARLIEIYEEEQVAHQEAATALPEGVEATEYKPDVTWEIRAQKLLSGIDPAEPWPDEDNEMPYLVVLAGHAGGKMSIIQRCSTRAEANERMEQIHRIHGGLENAAGVYKTILADEYDALSQQ